MGHHTSNLPKQKALELCAAHGMSEAEALEAYESSGDNMVKFASGNCWIYPDMFPLYIAAGYVPPQAFIDDVMSGTVTMFEHNETMGTQSGFPGWSQPYSNTMRLPSVITSDMNAAAQEPNNLFRIKALGNELAAAQRKPIAIGYLDSPELPLTIDPSLPAGFLTKLRGLQAAVEVSDEEDITAGIVTPEIHFDMPTRRIPHRRQGRGA